MKFNLFILILSVVPVFCYSQKTDIISPADTTTIIEYDTVFLSPDTIRKTNTIIIQQEPQHDTIKIESNKQSLSVSAVFSAFNLKSDIISRSGYQAKYFNCPSFLVGMQIRYVRNSMLIQSGFLLNYFSTNKTESYTLHADGSNIIPDAGSNLEVNYTTEFYNRFYYMDVPLMLGYYHEWGKFSFHFSAGPSLLILLASSAQTFNSNTQSIEPLSTSEMKRINSFLSAETGVSYSINKSWFLGAGIGFRKLILNDKYLPERNSQGYPILYLGITRNLDI